MAGYPFIFLREIEYNDLPTKRTGEVMAVQKKCEWCLGHPLYEEYHDREWGVPLHDDRKHFEFLVLDAMQAGLSWWIILKKRENFRRAFDGFDPDKVALYGDDKIEKLMADKGIVRNRNKILAAVQNAKAFLDVQDEFGSFDEYIWRFVGGQTIQNSWTRLADIPPKTKASEAASKELIERGFKFVGPTIVYAYWQAAGLVNDHMVHCFRHRELSAVD